MRRRAERVGDGDEPVAAAYAAVQVAGPVGGDVVGTATATAGIEGLVAGAAAAATAVVATAATGTAGSCRVERSGVAAATTGAKRAAPAGSADVSTRDATFGCARATESATRVGAAATADTRGRGPATGRAGSVVNVRSAAGTRSYEPAAPAAATGDDFAVAERGAADADIGRATAAPREEHATTVIGAGRTTTVEAAGSRAPWGCGRALAAHVDLDGCTGGHADGRGGLSAESAARRRAGTALGAVGVDDDGGHARGNRPGLRAAGVAVGVGRRGEGRLRTARDDRGGERTNANECTARREHCARSCTQQPCDPVRTHRISPLPARPHRRSKPVRGI